MWTVRLGGLPWGWGCEWLAIACRVSVGGDCVGFVYKTVETTAANRNNSGGRVLGLLCVEWNRAGSNLPAHFFPCQIFSKFWQFTFPLDRINFAS